MNYLKVYNRIVAKGKLSCRKRNDGTYYEAHHIVPKCIGGDGHYEQYKKHDNVVLLTAKEHFICHLLLHRAFPSSSKLSFALYGMINGRSNSFQGRHKASAKLYEELKTLAIENMRRLNTGRKQTPEHIAKVKANTDQTKIDRSYLRDPELVARRMKNTDVQARADKCKVPVLQYSTDGKFIKEWPGIVDATRYYTANSRSSISQCAKGVRRISYGFMWRFKEGDDISLMISPVVDKQTTARSIHQFTLQGEFVKTWSKVKEATSVYSINIIACAAGKQRTSGGYIWKYNID